MIFSALPVLRGKSVSVILTDKPENCCYWLMVWHAGST